ncbi:metallophosphoesterase family protein [Algoriphagus namhaensis]
MHRRPFLKTLTALGGTLATGNFISLSAAEYRRTQADFKTVFKFITASDGHFGQPSTDFIASHKNLIRAIEKEEQVDFVVFNGDLIHDEPGYMPEVKKMYDQLPVKYYVTRGNHDRISETEWQRIWGQPSTMSFTHQEKYGVILLSCSNEQGDYLCADLEVTKAILDGLNTMDQVYVFIHISQKDWTRHGVDCDAFLELLSAYPNVTAAFHGHDHDVDGVMWNRKKPYFWSGHFGGSWGNPFASYRVVEVDDQGVVRTALKTVADGTILNAHML